MTPPLALMRAAARLYRANATLYVGYVSWLLLTYAGLVLASLIPNPTVRAIVVVPLQMADMILWLWAGIVMTGITADVLSGTKTDTAALPKTSWKLLWPLAWVCVLQGVVTLGGLLLIIVPGLVFLVWFAYAQQAALLDGKRGLEALNASRELSRGRFWAVAWNLFAGPGLVGITYLLALSAVFAAISSLLRMPVSALADGQLPLWMDMLATVSEIFIMPLFYIYWTMSYWEMRK